MTAPTAKVRLLTYSRDNNACVVSEQAFDSWENRSGPKPDVVSIRRGLTLNQVLVDWRATLNGTRTCAVDGCENPHLARGLCGMHYRRLRKTGSVSLRPKPDLSDRRCGVEGCTQPYRAKGYCPTHWHRLHLYGDPLGSAERVDVKERFWSKVEKTDTCWLWQGAISDTGYGAFNQGDDGTISSHRYAYLTLVGAIPDGLHLDHLCRVRACCNPTHLEAVTPAENARRGDAPAAVTRRTNRCVRGHDLLISGRWVNRSTGQRTRYCIECQRIRRSAR